MLTEDGKHLYVSYDEYHDLIEKLAIKVHQSGWKFDTILCLARGGMRPGDVLSRIFDVPLAIMSTSSYRAEEGTVQGHLDIAHYITTPQGQIAGRVLLVDDMRETSGYTADTPVLFAGNGAPEAFQYKTGDFAQITSDTGVGYTGLNGAIIDNTRLTYFMRNFVGVSITYADAETGARLSALPEVKAMPIYPAAGSIALIDGVLVVKLSDITHVPAGG